MERTRKILIKFCKISALSIKLEPETQVKPTAKGRRWPNASPPLHRWKTRPSHSLVMIHHGNIKLLQTHRSISRRYSAETASSHLLREVSVPRQWRIEFAPKEICSLSGVPSWISVLMSLQSEFHDLIKGDHNPDRRACTSNSWACSSEEPFQASIPASFPQRIS